ncbi:hypothetical protein Pelo_8423 [Pelomyxa schiedti]|nr:hypothetical protein Pelo_8423 [Pelomyxa schiedti]
MIGGVSAAKFPTCPELVLSVLAASYIAKNKKSWLQLTVPAPALKRVPTWKNTFLYIHPLSRDHQPDTTATTSAASPLPAPPNATSPPPSLPASSASKTTTTTTPMPASSNASTTTPITPTITAQSAAVRTDTRGAPVVPASVAAPSVPLPGMGMGTKQIVSAPPKYQPDGDEDGGNSTGDDDYDDDDDEEGSGSDELDGGEGRGGGGEDGGSSEDDGGHHDHVYNNVPRMVGTGVGVGGGVPGAEVGLSLGRMNLGPQSQPMMPLPCTPTVGFGFGIPRVKQTVITGSSGADNNSTAAANTAAPEESELTRATKLLESSVEFVMKKKAAATGRTIAAPVEHVVATPEPRGSVLGLGGLNSSNIGSFDFMQGALGKIDRTGGVPFQAQQQETFVSPSDQLLMETPLPLSFPSANERLATVQATTMPSVPRFHSSAEQRQKASLKKQLAPLFAPDTSNPLGIPRGVKIFKPTYDQQQFKLKKLQMTERKPSTSLGTSVPLSDGLLTISKIEPSERPPMPIRLALLAVKETAYTVSQYEWDDSHQQYWTPNIFYDIPNFVVPESPPAVSANISTWNPSINRPMAPPTISNIGQLWPQTWGSAPEVSWVSFAQRFLEVFQVDVSDMKEIILCDKAATHITRSKWDKLYPYWANFNSSQIDMDALTMWRSSGWFYGLHPRSHCESLASGRPSQNTILIRCSDSTNALYVATLYRASIVRSSLCHITTTQVHRASCT